MRRAILPTHERRPLPDGLQDLTAEWLTEALRTAGVLRRANVVACDINQLGTGQAGTLVRLRPRYDLAESGAPATLIAKLPAPPGAVRDLAVRLGLYHREVTFYKTLAARARVRTPRIYGADADPSGSRAVLLMEDLAPAREGDLRAGCTLSQAEMLVDALACMHAAWWDHPELPLLPWLPAPNDVPAAILDEHRRRPDAWTQFRKRFARELPASIVTLGDRLQGDQSVLDRLSAPPRTLVHGDFRINNVMFAGGRVRAVIDWQTAAQARGPVDLACLFATSLAPADRLVAEAKLLPRYHRRLMERGVRGYSLAQCWTDYRLAVLNQFSQIVFLSAALDTGGHVEDDVGAVTGARLLTALTDLHLLDLAPPLGGRMRRFVRLGSAITATVNRARPRPRGAPDRQPEPESRGTAANPAVDGSAIHASADSHGTSITHG